MNRWFETIAALAVTAAWLGFAWSTDAGMQAEDLAQAEAQATQSVTAQEDGAGDTGMSAQEKALVLSTPGQERQHRAPSRI